MAINQGLDYYKVNGALPFYFIPLSSAHLVRLKTAISSRSSPSDNHPDQSDICDTDKCKSNVLSRILSCRMGQAAAPAHPALATHREVQVSREAGCRERPAFVHPVQRSGPIKSMILLGSPVAQTHPCVSRHSGSCPALPRLNPTYIDHC